jgi:hypothetical protein
MMAVLSHLCESMNHKLWYYNWIVVYLFWHLCCVSLRLLNSEVFFGQYKCWGPGANTTQRVPWAYDLTPAQAKPFLSVNFINGKSWLKSYIKTPKYTWHCGECPQVSETLLKITSDTGPSSEKMSGISWAANGMHSWVVQWGWVRSRSERKSLFSTTNSRWEKRHSLAVKNSFKTKKEGYLFLSEDLILLQHLQGNRFNFAPSRVCIIRLI